MSENLKIDAIEMQRIKERFYPEQEKEKEDLMILRERSLRIATEAAELLRRKYSVSRVLFFGSVLKPDLFHKMSDIDIAAWGIEPENTFKAIADVLYLGEDILTNLVDVNTCSQSLLNIILRDGVEI